MIFCMVYILSNFENGHRAEIYVEKNIALIGADVPRKLGFEGEGIKIGVIDTGIDFNNTDLLGFGPAGKVVSGYDFVDPNEKPMDTNGHGTEVAGVIAADGNLKGVAPKAQLFAYKVSSDGQSVSSELIIKAIRQAIQDKVNVINISLGINKTNSEIDQAVNEAVRNGIVVVVAAGNNGPDLSTIGSPGRDNNAITVGASYNNITESLVSTLEVGKIQYQVIPMLGTKALSKPITTKIVFGGYGRAKDLSGLNVTNSILLEERGSNIIGEKVFFATKEYNAAQSGAKALIVFNNELGIFYGELVQPNSSNYIPRIPVISMSESDGLNMIKSLQGNMTAKLDVFYHPDFVAPFSSRGPVSPFYTKPDLVAPGVFVNSTMIGNKYNITSGTSIAAPHVTGAVALLLQKIPNLKPVEVTSLLTTTSDPVTDSYGRIVPLEVAGSGRLNLTRAFSANLIIIPHSLVFDLSFEKPYQTRSLDLKSIHGIIPLLRTEFSTENTFIRFEKSLNNDTLNVKISDTERKVGDFEGVITIFDNKTRYRVPVLIHVTNGTINTTEKDGVLTFQLDYPAKWVYAKISVIKVGDDESRFTSITPEKNSSLSVYESGEYWIDAQITTPNGVDNAYDTIIVQQPAQKTWIDFAESSGIPIKYLIIISGVLLAAVAIGIKSRPR